MEMPMHCSHTGLIVILGSMVLGCSIEHNGSGSSLFGKAGDTGNAGASESVGRGGRRGEVTEEGGASGNATSEEGGTAGDSSEGGGSAGRANGGGGSGGQSTAGEDAGGNAGTTAENGGAGTAGEDTGGGAGTAGEESGGSGPGIINDVTMTIEPSESDQEISWNGIEVTIPGGLLTSEETLTLALLDDPPSPNFPALELGAAYEVKLGDIHQLSVPMTIKMAYDPSLLRADLEAERNLSAAYYDEAQGVWVSVPVTVDETTGEVILVTNHLTTYGWFMWNLGYNIITDDRFTLAYDRAELLDSTRGPDPNYAKNADSANWTDSDIPDYIEDTFAYLNAEYQRYKSAGFREPWIPLNVYVGGTADSQRGKFFGHGLNLNLNSMSQKQLKGETGHEMFHSFEGAYLGPVGMGTAELPIVGWAPWILSWSSWFVESSAEYASEHVAWDGTLGYRPNSLKADYLSSPLYLTTDSDHMYSTAVFLKYLVDQGADFKKMCEYVFSYDWSNLNDYYYPLSEYLESVYGSGQGLPQQYRKFARYVVFDPSGPLSSITNSLHTDVASYRTSMTAGNAESATFALTGGYTAKLWGIWVDGAFGETTSNMEYTVTVDGTLPTKVEMDVYVLKGDARATGTAPVGTLSQTTRSVPVTVEKGDAIYVLAVNWDPSDATVTAKVTEVAGESRPAALSLDLSWGSGCNAGCSGTHSYVFDVTVDPTGKFTYEEKPSDFFTTVGLSGTVVDSDATVGIDGITIDGVWHSPTGDSKVYEGTFHIEASGYDGFEFANQTPTITYSATAPLVTGDSCTCSGDATTASAVIENFIY